MLPQARKFWLKLITFKLAAFEGELVKLKGSCLVNVQYENIYHTLTLIVTKGHCPNLLELNWILFSSGYVPVGTKMLSEMSKDCLPMRL
ncbi:hypothetical protein T4A_10072 [Trichinella pseudospiralis]|uniref:Uncharacterized protein n=1 Tax=Trichinella pseudospiralis TaxID=6337 RepID=A0A0V1DSH3_TRIPS|nr:hypothetical protein T4A_10072 [Trichinella pseudospiralis]